ncbi:MAG: AEC family transporter [Pseudomonadota bacterium]
MGFLDIAAIILPVFGVVAVGYLARLTGLLGDDVGEALSKYVFTIAIPCLLFRIMADGNWPDISPWGYWVSYFAGIAVVWTASSLIMTRLLKRDGPTGVVAGFTAGQSNTVLIGIPLILAVYGEAGAIPVVALISIHLPIMMGVAAILMELSDRSAADWRGTAKALARNIVLHPIILGIAIGAAWHALNLPTEGLLRPVLDSIAGTASTCALFSLGLALRRYGVAGDLRASLSVTALKVIVHPAIVLVLGVHVFQLPPVWLGAAMLFAASPSGINAYLVAGRYGTGMRISSSAIALSTAVAVVTVGLWLKIIPIPG